ncbi:hypothetical protein DM02DRAFT_308507 [Periconia macrospinosa]|uniref:5-formyltetrahydrofolate cyclo-ligase n=1 Tax=Periconia macrospinosa TaxID=97972 RepID=A0A2V1DZM5_9PLEO|nr:hypothetical protein DM02DRAFT_308507 [Periconia macrospinosa]
MTKRESLHVERRQKIWQHVHRELIKHAKSDSRFHFDFLSFTPDFHDSSLAVDCLIQLPAYQNATTILVTSENSLEELRYRALKDGKTLMVGTYRLRRGFVLLNPAVIEEKELRMASWLDGMEKPGIGRSLSLAQMQDEHIRVDLCVFGGLAFNKKGVVVWEGQGLFEVQWALLNEMKLLQQHVPVVAIAHDSQVVDEADLELERIVPEKAGEVQCDFIVSPGATIEVKDPVRPTGGLDFEALDPHALEQIPPLQELKGIKMMEQIMKTGKFGENNEKASDMPLSPDEQAGISMVERIMKGLKP